jgi:mRNA-degrading endonuclease toxin of MazEF toxin-antitoxin module
VSIPVRPELGRIVRVDGIVDSWGNPTHEHPAVILTGRAEIEAGQPIVVAIISSQLHLSKPADRVALPWQDCRGGHYLTQLNRNCAAVCTWTEVIEQSNIREYKGTVPSYALAEILKKVAALKKPPPSIA